jgi:hypothetical protein
MEMMEDSDDDDDEDSDGSDDMDEEGDDTDFLLARLEHLMDRRPLLLSSVLLRQNPHNVHEWHKRVKLFKDPTKVLLEREGKGGGRGALFLFTAVRVPFFTTDIHCTNSFGVLHGACVMYIHIYEYYCNISIFV